VPPDVLSELGRLLDLHALALEDIPNEGQQAKMEEYNDRIFVVMHLPALDESGALHLEQVSRFLAKGVVVSFYGEAHEPFEPIRERLRRNIGRVRGRGCDYLFYALLDTVVDHAFPLLESYGSASRRSKTRC
jgi:magnesium transporter